MSFVSFFNDYEYIKALIIRIKAINSNPEAVKELNQILEFLKQPSKTPAINALFNNILDKYKVAVWHEDKKGYFLCSNEAGTDLILERLNPPDYIGKKDFNDIFYELFKVGSLRVVLEQRPKRWIVVIEENWLDVYKSPFPEAPGSARGVLTSVINITKIIPILMMKTIPGPKSFSIGLDLGLNLKALDDIFQDLI